MRYKGMDLPDIIDEDIVRVTKLMKLPENAFLGCDGKDPRQEVLKCMKSIDVAACPGSGKTTLLVAKLAILAEKWQCRTRGMCVLSHTNAARQEIQSRLGNSPVGRQLLSYPHFIGTIHSFVNEFLAVPWLRSKGYPINMIDNDFPLKYRWRHLTHKAQYAFEKNQYMKCRYPKKENLIKILKIASPDGSVGPIIWQKGVTLDYNSPTYYAIKKACKESIEAGLFCYDEMFVWAKDLIDHRPEVLQVIRERFPLLFIDEAQDNSEEQASMLHNIFMDEPEPVIRQRFGDSNQAIYFSTSDGGATTDCFPNNDIKRDLPNSFRFGQNIANLADPLGLKPYGLVGQGPQKTIDTAEIQNTIFVFEEKNIGQVLNCYGDLLLETFPDDALRTGPFTAVGMIHKVPENDPHIPESVCNYWSSYEPELSHLELKLETFVRYVFAGQWMAQASGSTHSGIEKVAEGILRLARMGKTTGRVPNVRYRHRYILKILDECPELLEMYRNLIGSLFIAKESLSSDLWKQVWRDKVISIASGIRGYSVDLRDETFLEWREDSCPCRLSSDSTLSPNIYRYSRDGKNVDIQLGSIHSVKGQTHMATLVLETCFYKFNLEKILKCLCCKPKGSGLCKRDKKRFKIHYVALTRPSHLLCLAMKKSSFENGNTDLITKMKNAGWSIRNL